jgi:hypothetical protein
MQLYLEYLINPLETIYHLVFGNLIMLADLEKN